jgi:tRNA-dihydrouridine synthase
MFWRQWLIFLNWHLGNYAGSIRYHCAILQCLYYFKDYILFERFYIRIICKAYLSSNVYRKEVFSTKSSDRPLFIQLSGDDPEKFVNVAKEVERYGDAIDINFGCPQNHAKKGHYGAFLQDEWDLMRKIGDYL